MSRFRKLVIFIISAFALFAIFNFLFSGFHIHSFPGPKKYFQHLYFDGLADAGGFYASLFCKHWYHRIPIAIGFALLSTYILVIMVG